MKKTLLALAALLVMGFRLAGAQNYKVEYDVKIKPDVFIGMMSTLGGLTEDMMEPAKKGAEEMEIVFNVNMSEDKEDAQLVARKSRFELNMNGIHIDMTDRLENIGFNYYKDHSANESYMKVNVLGKKYYVKNPAAREGKFTPVEGTRTILGHECKLMKNSNNTKVWYATDIPFETKAYEGVPGLVLGIEDENFMNATAKSFKANDKEISIPKKAKVVTPLEFQKIMTGM